ncbi:hypothetical protein ABG82_04845 [Mycobacteroides immunogenum]|uniref:Uncharacterized protein n=1 Tax=Mycobacteroides immunogenum TaxID=83262 RepID=A0A7V8LKG9_9MYCO|nr:hypothetical protein ABG82_04845 [Mycobacteroides immunogenum]ANO02814.1 hypothetical protein BAB75_04870 [Mycobacteroides immunogenum]KIU39242.1 hypothetical protein TL11_18445 [Mycobacteroides immunogenum]KPG02769.1 hypothetical protein AN909_26865 [Mycobacteroides immunogenum]KPG03342.1 hypothetical protein AN910_26460 [Mycobacteroides immunogenum]
MLHKIVILIAEAEGVARWRFSARWVDEMSSVLPQVTCKFDTDVSMQPADVVARRCGPGRSKLDPLPMFSVPDPVR